jgi:hypothetical protein
MFIELLPGNIHCLQSHHLAIGLYAKICWYLMLHHIHGCETFKYPPCSKCLVMRKCSDLCFHLSMVTLYCDMLICYHFGEISTFHPQHEMTDSRPDSCVCSTRTVTVEGFDVLFDGFEDKDRKQHLETKDPFQDFCLYSKRRCV